MATPFKRLVPGGTLSAREYNRALVTLEAHDHLVTAAGDGMTASRIGGGMAVRNERPHSIWIEILSGSNPYAWREVAWGGSAFYIPANGRTGTTTDIPAYEVEGKTDVPTGYYARAWLASDELSYEFTWSEGNDGTIDGTLTVREVDTSPTVTSVGILEFDQDDGFVVSEPAPGIARVDLGWSFILNTGGPFITAYEANPGPLNSALTTGGLASTLTAGSPYRKVQADTLCVGGVLKVYSKYLRTDAIGTVLGLFQTSAFYDHDAGCCACPPGPAAGYYYGYQMTSILTGNPPSGLGCITTCTACASMSRMWAVQFFAVGSQFSLCLWLEGNWFLDPHGGDCVFSQERFVNERRYRVVLAQRTDVFGIPGSRWYLEVQDITVDLANFYEAVYACPSDFNCCGDNVFSLLGVFLGGAPSCVFWPANVTVRPLSLCCSVLTPGPGFPGQEGPPADPDTLIDEGVCCLESDEVSGAPATLKLTVIRASGCSWMQDETILLIYDEGPQHWIGRMQTPVSTVTLEWIMLCLGDSVRLEVAVKADTGGPIEDSQQAGTEQIYVLDGPLTCGVNFTALFVGFAELIDYGTIFSFDCPDAGTDGDWEVLVNVP